MDEHSSLDRFWVFPALVAVHLEAGTAEEVIIYLSDLLMSHGYVKPSYAQAAIERERTSPTGLPTPGVGTAIPHAGLEHTLKPGMAVGTLAAPVSFGEMGKPSSHIDVSLVFVLSVTEPTAQVYLLQSIISMFKDAALLRKLQAATDPDVVVQELNEALSKVAVPKPA